MTRSWRIAGPAAFGLAALALGGGLRAPAGAETEIRWFSDWESAQAAARQSGKPLFVAFR